jgi:hypothetical protein
MVRFTVILAQFYVWFINFFFDLSSYHAEDTVCLNYKEQFRSDTAYLGLHVKCLLFFSDSNQNRNSQQLLFRTRYMKYH